MIVIVVALGAFALPASAGAYVYWTNNGGGLGTTIGRGNLDGTNVDQSFIVGASAPQGVAVDASHIYWANSSAGTIGRANLDGTNVEQSFIGGASTPEGVAVDGAHIYWANFSANMIGRANLDGTNVDQSFISATTPDGVAVDGGHVYWTSNTLHSIGRANLNGSSPDQSFISATNPFGVAVDGAHVYWADFSVSGGTIGRANLDGTSPNDSFILGAHGPQGVAVDDAHVYWANAGNPSTPGTTIGRGDLDASDVDQSFIGGASAPDGVAVDSLPHTSRTGLRCAPQTVTPGQTTRCTTTLTDTGPFATPPGALAPTGTVALSSNGPGAGTSCDLILAGTDSSCTLTYTPSATGAQLLRASYGGDFAHTGSSDDAALSVIARPSNRFSFGRPRLNKRKGTAKLPVAVPGPGTLTLRGKGLVRQRSAPRAKAVRRFGIVRLAVKPKGRAKRRLKHKGTARVTAKVTYAPSGGNPRTKHKKLTLKRKRR